MIDQIEKTDIETDIGKRWVEGTPHHPKAEELARIIGELDFLYADDSFRFKFGGDGDNGETLTYLLDIFFEFKDKTGFKLGKSSIKKSKLKTLKTEWRPYGPESH